MSPDHCELCGKDLMPGGFYVVRIDVFADPKMPPVSRAELDLLDFGTEMDDLLDQMKNMTAEQLQNQVHRRFEFRICPACQPGLLGDPLGKKLRGPLGDSMTD